MGLEYATFDAYHTPNTKQEIKMKNKITHSFVRCTIAFSVCNKLFKRLGLPSG
jgi:hypothetical protein